MERDGDGWLECDCGSRHWGIFGAAGLLLVDSTGDEISVLLQLRAGWSHNGGTWAIPGGARDSHEDSIATALREAEEEVGVPANLVSVFSSFSDDHGSWRYDTVIATASRNSITLLHNRETDDAQWVPVEKVDQLPLHAAFATAWPALRELIGA